MKQWVLEHGTEASSPVVASSKKEARQLILRQLDRKRLPKGGYIREFNRPGGTNDYVGPYQVVMVGFAGSEVYQIQDANGRVRGTRVAEEEAHERVRELNESI